MSNAMLTVKGLVRTERPSRYIIKLCRHAGQMNRHQGMRRRTHGSAGAFPEVQHVEWSDTRGSLSFGWAQCTLWATEDGLALLVEAANEEALRRLQVGLGGRLETLGVRDQLKVRWEPPQTSPAAVTHTSPST